MFINMAYTWVIHEEKAFERLVLLKERPENHKKPTSAVILT